MPANSSASKLSSIIVIDLGSQYTQLIARRIRELNIHSLIVSHTIKAKDLSSMNAQAIILSGGPASVYEHEAPKVDAAILALDIPILGICYGLQLLVEHFGGQVSAQKHREYGAQSCEFQHSPLFADIPNESQVWMSHGDSLTDCPAQLQIIAQTETCEGAAFAHRERKVFGLQFHPEVSHSQHGHAILRNFCVGIAGCKQEWQMDNLVTQSIESIRAQVGDRHVICGLSGGIDSSVVALLLKEAIGAQLHCVFVDNGLLRHDEVAEVESIFRPILGAQFHIEDASQRFLDGLKNVTDPEQKRKVIGHTFIEVFSEVAERLQAQQHIEISCLAQGTLYTDVIESYSPRHGPSVTIKSHHNVGGLPEKLNFELVEPLRSLFKDEVRALAAQFGVPELLIKRQPFPGPGLAIRILGEVNERSLSLVRQADYIVQQEFAKSGWLDRVWQSFAVLLPVNSVGVMGDQRTYEQACVLRIVESLDGMTADWVSVPRELLVTCSNRIINEVAGINRVCLDISSKPPATIEWE